MPKNATIFLVPHFHYDPIWIEDQSTYTRWAFQLVQQYLDACRRDDAYEVLMSEMDFLKPYWDAFPEDRAFLLELSRQGRLHTGGSYSEANQMSLQGEAIVRNIFYGRHFHSQQLESNPRTYVPLDVFGQVVQLGQILRKSGFAGTIFSKHIAGAFPLSFGLALDGSRVIQKRERYGWRPKSLEEFEERVGQGLEDQQKLGLSLDLRMIGGDMAAPAEWLTGKCSELRGLDPSIVVGGPDDYLDALEREIEEKSVDLPVVSRDLSLYHAGTAVSRADLKISNRLGENRVMDAEKFATIAALLGAEYPEAALDKAWRQLLFGQHHDAITGTLCDISFLDLLAGYRDSLELSDSVLRNSLAYICSMVNTAAATSAAQPITSLVVFNAVSWTRADVCRARVEFASPVPGFALTDSGGRQLPCQLISCERGRGGVTCAEFAFRAENIAPLGHRVFHVVPASSLPPSAAPKAVSEATIANEFFSITVGSSAGGGITSLKDLKEQRELMRAGEHPGNQLAALKEKPDRAEPPWEVFTTGEKQFSKDYACEITVEEGPVFKRITVTGRFGEMCGRRQEITLFEGLRLVDFRCELENYRSEHDLVVVTFPLDLKGVIPVFEDRFGSVARKRSRLWLDFRTHQNRIFSDCALYAAQNWLDFGPSVRVECGRGSKRAVFPLGYTAIVTGSAKAHKHLAYRLEEALAKKGVTCTPWTAAGSSAPGGEEAPDLDADRPYCTFRIALATPGSNSYAEKLLIQATGQARSSFEARLERRGQAFMVVRRSDGPEGWEPLPELLVMGRDGEALDSCVQKLCEDLDDGVISLPEEANGTGAEGAADDYGVSIVNRGTLGGSVENDGTMALFLMHTSSWPGFPWGKGKLEPFFVPERKTHVFRYALLPHAGTWREADVPGAGCEFNHPLIAVQENLHDGPIPSQHSFATVEPSNLVMTALKPKGNSLAAYQAGRRISPEEGVVVRVYDAKGEASQARLSFWLPVLSVWKTDLLENRVEEVKPKRGVTAWDVGPFSIETLEIQLERPPQMGEKKSLGPSSEAHQPLHCRYWEHNLGSAPMGNQPITLTLRGQAVLDATTRFSLAVANDMTDSEVKGSVKLSAPDGWTLTPRIAPYRIEPRGHQLFEISVSIPKGSRPGFIRAAAEYGGQTYEDIMAVGDIKPLEASILRNSAGFEVQVTNPNDDRVYGQVALITPPETWGEHLVGDMALAHVGPASQSFDLAPGQTVSLRFEGEGKLSGADSWAVAKVMAHGKLIYIQAEG